LFTDGERAAGVFDVLATGFSVLLGPRLRRRRCIDPT